MICYKLNDLYFLDVCDKSKTNLPGAFFINFMRLGSLDGSLVSGPFSRAFILFFCSFNSNSTLKNPAQYNTIDKTEMMETNEGKLCF